MTDVLIVDALSAGTGLRRSSRDSIGCGPRTIAGIFEKHGIMCKILRVESLLETPSKVRRFDHLAVSAMTMDLPVVKQVFTIWRKNRSRRKILLGGPIASDPMGVLKEIKPDVLVIGEGEETLDELIQEGFLNDKVDLGGFKGVAFSDKSGPIVTSPRSLIPANKLWSEFVPSSTRIVDYPAYQASKVYVETIRGCSNFRRTSLPLPDGRECTDCGNCDSSDPAIRTYCPEDIPPGCGFCSVPSVWGEPRSRDSGSIVKEIEELLNLGVHRIVLEAPDFLDYMREGMPLTNPCEPKANIAEISHLIRRITDLPQMVAGEAHLAIENMKACLFTEDVALALSGVLKSTSPNIGIETGSESHSKQIGKCGSPQDVIRAVRLAREYDMNPFVYFIYGLPGDSPETVEESIACMKTLADAGADRIILYGFRPLPSSAFADFSAPTSTNPLAEQLREAATRINRDKKTDYIGLVVRGIAAEPSWERHGFTMIYPLNEGPIITVEGGYSSGTLLDVKIIDILSPGLLLGEVL
ncbi:MAG: radical SAM protein [Candidatus Thorarchaeota archaeon]|nr:radical SAM protein [Candidatus Thorarchaeota archaeon]